VFTNPKSKEDMDIFDPQSVLFADSLVNYGFEVIWGLQGEDFYRYLSEASVVVIRGLADTLNLVAVEAVYLGIPVVAPDIAPYFEYLPDDCLYKAFDIDELLAKVRQPVWVDKKCVMRYDYREVFKRIEIIVRGFDG